MELRWALSPGKSNCIWSGSRTTTKHDGSHRSTNKKTKKNGENRKKISIKIMASEWLLSKHMFHQVSSMQAFLHTWEMFTKVLQKIAEVIHFCGPGKKPAGRFNSLISLLPLALMHPRWWWINLIINSYYLCGLCFLWSLNFKNNSIRWQRRKDRFKSKRTWAEAVGRNKCSSELISLLCIILCLFLHGG